MTKTKRTVSFRFTAWIKNTLRGVKTQFLPFLSFTHNSRSQNKTLACAIAIRCQLEICEVDPKGQLDPGVCCVCVCCVCGYLYPFSLVYSVLVHYVRVFIHTRISHTSVCVCVYTSPFHILSLYVSLCVEAFASLQTPGSLHLLNVDIPRPRGLSISSWCQHFCWFFTWSSRWLMKFMLSS